MKIDRAIWFGGSAAYRTVVSNLIGFAIKAGKLRRPDRCQMCETPKKFLLPGGAEVTANEKVRVQCWLCTACINELRRDPNITTITLKFKEPTCFKLV